jgi:hypothetical protein
VKFFCSLCCFLLSLGASAQDFPKCGTQMMLEARRIGTIQSKLGHAPFFQPPSMSDSLTSPDAKFRIHFSTTGDNAATLEYAQFVASEADAAYRFQCDTLGFPQPAFTFADSMWHIYISNLSDRIYGYTAYVNNGELGTTPAGFTKLRSFIVVDNDYLGTPTKGFDAARITIEHEFFHVIQFGCYGALKPIDTGYGLDDINFVEMSSVWMEMLSTPWVLDYLFFIESYLANIDKTLDKVPNQGYSQGIWPKFIEQRFGHIIMQESWEHYSGVSGDPLEAFEHAIGLHNSTFCEEYKRFGAELTETGRRYRGTVSLPDAAKYPVDKLKINRVLPNDPITFASSTSTNPASLNIVAAGFGEDTSFVTIARNTDFFTADATLTITGKKSFTATYQFPEMFCDTLIEYDALKTMAFPVPLVISQKENTSVLRIKTTSTGTKPISPPRLSVYTFSMKLVHHSEEEAEPFGGSWYSKWDGTDDTGDVVSSGMYVFVLEVDGKTTLGKFPVIVK